MLHLERLEEEVQFLEMAEASHNYRVQNQIDDDNYGFDLMQEMHNLIFINDDATDEEAERIMQQLIDQFSQLRIEP